MTTRRPGIISRLGNLIVVQVLFIFAALALILFVPGGDQELDRQLADLERELIEIGRQAIGSDVFSQGSWEEIVAQPEMNEFFDSVPRVTHAAIIRVRDGERLEVQFAYSRAGTNEFESGVALDISSYSSYPMLRLMTLSTNDMPRQTAFSTDHLAYYERLAVDEAGLPVPLLAFLERIVGHVQFEHVTKPTVAEQSTASPESSEDED